MNTQDTLTMTDEALERARLACMSRDDAALEDAILCCEDALRGESDVGSRQWLETAIVSCEEMRPQD